MDADVTADADGGRRADGRVGEWRTELPMPHGRANFCAAVAGGFVVVLGGNYRPAGAPDFVRSDLVHAARIGADGTLVAWVEAGRLPSATTECVAAAHGADVYVLGGLTDVDADRFTLRRATISDTGELGEWADVSRLPTDRTIMSSEAWVHEGRYLVMDTELPESGDTTSTLGVELGAVGATWREDEWSVDFRNQAEYAFSGSFLYVLGGYLSSDDGNAVSDEAFAAPLDAGGAVGASFAIGAIPRPTCFGEAVVVDDYLFLVGGRDQMLGANGTTDVSSAPLGPDGATGAWADQTPLPEGRNNHEVVAAGDYLYALGGGYDGPGLDTVFSAQVRWDE